MGKQLAADGAEAIATCRKSNADLDGAGAKQIIPDVEVTSTDSLKKMAGAVTGPLDYIIFNAGIFPDVVDNLDSPAAGCYGAVRCLWLWPSALCVRAQGCRASQGREGGHCFFSSRFYSLALHSEQGQGHRLWTSYVPRSLQSWCCPHVRGAEEG